MNTHSYKKGFTQHHKNGAGFTLIEVLVVISLIGLLSAIVLASLSTTRAKGRDTARIVDVRELKKAIEFYYNDQSPTSYPKVGSEGAANEVVGLDTPLRGGAVKYIGGIAQTLIDGDGSGTSDLYGWRSTGTQAADPADSYAIIVYTETLGYPGGLCKTGAGPQYMLIVPSVSTICNF